MPAPIRLTGSRRRRSSTRTLIDEGDRLYLRRREFLDSEYVLLQQHSVGAVRHQRADGYEGRRQDARIQSMGRDIQDRKSTRLNSSHSQISYAVFCLKKKKKY